MNRASLIQRLMPYKASKPIKHALDRLVEVNDDTVSNDVVGDVWERVSVAIDNDFSDDTNHPMWSIEFDLSQAYKRD